MEIYSTWALVIIIIIIVAVFGVGYLYGKSEMKNIKK